jgi:hypothetical protein
MYGSTSWYAVAIGLVCAAALLVGAGQVEVAAICVITAGLALVTHQGEEHSR